MAKSLDYPRLRQQQRFGAKTQPREPAKTQLPEPAENKDATEQYIETTLEIYSEGELTAVCGCTLDFFFEYYFYEGEGWKAKMEEARSQQEEEGGLLFIVSISQFIDFGICYCTPATTSSE